MRRIAVIEDLSCIGRCSLGVAMAILPAMGLETCALPTAILSNHTAFDGFTFVDFTDSANEIVDMWKKLEFTFDSIYIGYLGSNTLIDMTARFLDLFATDETRVILDPAFADNGKLYKGFDMNYVRGIRGLCSRADVILPNVSEACFLLETEPVSGAEGTKRIAEASRELLQGRLRNVVITSAEFDGGMTGLICTGDDAFAYPHEKLILSCHGTGDVFGSVFSGMYSLGASIETASRHAADFTFRSLRYSMTLPDRRWYGVDFEPLLGDLAQETKACFQ